MRTDGTARQNAAGELRYRHLGHDPAKKPQVEHHHQADDHADEQEVHGAQTSSRAGATGAGGIEAGGAGGVEAAGAGAGSGAVRRRRRRTRTGTGHRASSPPRAMMIAPTQIQVTRGSTISRKLTGHGWVTKRAAMPVIAWSRSCQSGARLACA